MAESLANVIIRREGGILIVAFSRPDVIDQIYIKEASNEIFSAVQKVQRPFVVMDFERVRYLSSGALSLLIALQKLCKERGGAICIANVVEEVAGVFTLTKLPKLIDICRTTKSAIKNLQTAGAVV